MNLHNNFDFVSYEYKIAKRQLKLVWVKPGNWVSNDKVSRLEIIHSNVFYFKVNYQHINESSDDECLGEVSYFPSSERAINNAFTSQTKPNDGDDILYVFESGYFIRVGCSEIEIIVA